MIVGVTGEEAVAELVDIVGKIVASKIVFVGVRRQVYAPQQLQFFTTPLYNRLEKMGFLFGVSSKFTFFGLGF